MVMRGGNGEVMRGGNSPRPFLGGQWRWGYPCTTVQQDVYSAACGLAVRQGGVAVQRTRPPQGQESAIRAHYVQSIVKVSRQRPLGQGQLLHLRGHLLRTFL